MPPVAPGRSKRIAPRDAFLLGFFPVRHIGVGQRENKVKRVCWFSQRGNTGAQAARHERDRTTSALRGVAACGAGNPTKRRAVFSGRGREEEYNRKTRVGTRDAVAHRSHPPALWLTLTHARTLRDVAMHGARGSKREGKGDRLYRCEKRYWELCCLLRGVKARTARRRAYPAKGVARTDLCLNCGARTQRGVRGESVGFSGQGRRGRRPRPTQLCASVEKHDQAASRVVASSNFIAASVLNVYSWL